MIVWLEINRQQTIGMRIVNIKVVNQTGQKPTSMQVIIRNILSYGLIGGTLAIQGRFLDMTAYAPHSQLTLISQIVLGLSFVLLLFLVDLLLETFSKKHRLFFEKWSGTDTRISN